MLVIRDEQMAVLEHAARRGFEERTLAHLQQCFPQDVKALGEENACVVIREGVRRAQGYGISSERGLWLFIDLMFQLGGGFDTDPQLPWAAEALQGEALDEYARIDRLEAKLAEYLEKVTGAEGQHFRAALERLRDAAPDLPAAVRSGRNFETAAMLKLQFIFPEKYAWLGPERVWTLVRGGFERAQRHGLVTPGGTLLFIELSFVFGSGFDQDAQFPWFKATVSDPAFKDEQKKIERLRQQARDHIGLWLEEQ